MKKPTKKPGVERPDDIIPTAEVARRRNVSRKAVLNEARRDPRHPPPIPISGTHAKARKGFRRGPLEEFERLKDALAEEDRQRRLAAKQEQAGHGP